MAEALNNSITNSTSPLSSGEVDHASNVLPAQKPHHYWINKDSTFIKQEVRTWALLTLAGAFLGLAAPGFDQWYIAWFGLCPLLFATLTSKNIPQAFYRGLGFGYGYTLVYNITFLQFTMDVWPESMLNYIWLANPIIWIIVALQQGAITGTFCSFVKWLPLNQGFLPRRTEGKLTVPALVLIPLAWCLIYNKFGNHQLSLGMPWALLEYTQYNQKEFIQIASIIGGIGISALIVMANVAILYLVASLAKTRGWIQHSLGTLRHSFVNSFIILVLLFGIKLYGAEKIRVAPLTASAQPHEVVTLLQGNAMFESKSKNPMAFLKTYKALAANSPPSICIWPEWSIPASATQYKEGFESFGQTAKLLDQDWIIGCLDGTSKEVYFNSVCGINSKGKLIEPIYHKHYLVPFAEYTPKWVLNSPLGGLCGTLTPRRIGYTQGTETAIFKLRGKKIAPVLCCELASPELNSKGVREGAQLLVDCSNTSWFNSKIIGTQCIAACIIRAIENHRCMAFATTLGPSVILDAEGYVKVQTPQNKPSAVSFNTPFYSDITPFVRWFR